MKTIINALENRPTKWFPKSQSGSGKIRKQSKNSNLKIKKEKPMKHEKPKKIRNTLTKDLRKFCWYVSYI